MSEKIVNELSVIFSLCQDILHVVSLKPSACLFMIDWKHGRAFFTLSRVECLRSEEWMLPLHKRLQSHMC